MRKKYRSHVGVLLDILRTLNEEGKATISVIIMKANIPYERLKPYLKKLVSEGYIEVIKESERKYYVLTPTGVKLLDELEGIKKLFTKLGFPL